MTAPDSKEHTYSAKAPAARAENLIAWLELGYVPTDRFDPAGYINARSPDLRFA
jgi:hypothetical protein